MPEIVLAENDQIRNWPDHFILAMVSVSARASTCASRKKSMTFIGELAISVAARDRAGGCKGTVEFASKAFRDLSYAAFTLRSFAISLAALSWHRGVRQLSNGEWQLQPPPPQKENGYGCRNLVTDARALVPAGDTLV
jgi:hypothetical protein